MALQSQDIHGLQREQPNECRSFLFGVIKRDRHNERPVRRSYLQLKFN